MGWAEENLDDWFCKHCGKYLGEGTGETGTLCADCGAKEWEYWETFSQQSEETTNA